MSLVVFAAGLAGTGRVPTRHIIAMFVDAVSYITHYGRVSIVICMAGPPPQTTRCLGADLQWYT